MFFCGVVLVLFAGTTLGNLETLGVSLGVLRGLALDSCFDAFCIVLLAFLTYW